MSHVEASTPAVPPELGGGAAEELAYRLVQQKILADFGLFALGCTDFDRLLQRATELCAQGLAAVYCKALEYVPDQDSFLVRAGVGWKKGVVGSATIGADLKSPAGFALKTGRAVISNHLSGETRFRTPALLVEYGIKRAINVIIASSPNAVPFGVLEVDSPSEGRFEEADLAFMQGFANLLGVAIERHHAELQRRRGEEHFRAVLEHAPLKMWMNEADGSALYYNAAWRNYTGFSATPQGCGWTSAIHPEDRPRVMAVRTQAIADGHAYETEVRLRRAQDGACRWHMAQVTPLKEAGQVYAWVGTATDIHDIRTAEADLRHQFHLMRTITEHAAEALFMMDAEGRVTFANPAAERMFGWSRDEVVGQMLHDLLRHRDQDNRPYPASSSPLVSAPSTAQALRDHEDVFYRKDGSRVDVIASNAPIVTEGRIDGAVLVVRDITERKRAEGHRRLLMSEMNHRVKNTLATVQAITTQTLRNAPSVDAARSTLIERLMALAKTHDVLMRDSWEGADLADIVTTALEPHAGARERFQVAGPHVSVPAHTALALSMALHEMSTNAAKYGALSNETGVVAIRWATIESRDGPRLHLTWAESGGPPVRPSVRTGFGSRLIERALARELGGEARIAFEPAGVVYSINAPLRDS